MKKLAVLIAAVMVAAGAYADVIALYTFEASSIASSDTAANSTAGNFQRAGADLTGFATGNGGGLAANGNGWQVGTGTADWSWFGFTLSLDSGYRFDFESLAFDERKSGTGPGDYAVYYDAGAGFTLVQTETLASDTTFHTMTANANTFSSTASSIAFRIYGYNTTASTGTWRNDNVTLNGTVVVPEPGSMALLGLGVGALVLFRRRMK